MTTYAFGDLQGCYEELRLLLDHIEFDPSLDKLCFTGDLVNRGPDSLKVLEYLYSINESVVNVLGNHDFHLIALALTDRKLRSKDNSLSPILSSSNKINLIEWLRHQPLFHMEKESDTLIVHAGVHPSWTLEMVKKYSEEIQSVIRGDDASVFFKAMYSDDSWSTDLIGKKRFNAIVNSITRMRYINELGECNFEEKDSPEKVTNELIPWYLYPNRKVKNDLIVFGHWSSLGYFYDHNVVCLDGGCVWGGELVAVDLSKPDVPIRINSLKSI